MSLSTKILTGIIFFIIFLVGLGAWDIRQSNIKNISLGMPTANAGILDDIGAAIGGHIDDFKDRSKADEFISGTTIKSGEFTYTKDPVHYAEGDVMLIEKDGETYVQLGTNFVAGFAPDLYIYTSTSTITSQSDVDLITKTNLQKLTKGSSASYYKVTGDVKSVVIWCKRFNQFMGSAIVK